MKIKTVCVYCASSTKIKDDYYSEAEILGKELARNDIKTVYGGGAVGLMGELADSVIKNNGKIKGVIPRFMQELEWAHKGLTELVLVDDMHQRKKMMIENSDAVIALPGGTGTLEELSEAITMKRLGLYFKPIIIVNKNEFYSHLISMLQKMAEEKFIRKEHLKMWTIVDNVKDIVKTIEQIPLWDKNARDFAAV